VAACSRGDDTRARQLIGEGADCTRTYPSAGGEVSDSALLAACNSGSLACARAIYDATSGPAFKALAE
jgi:hypothetical protein